MNIIVTIKHLNIKPNTIMEAAANTFKIENDPFIRRGCFWGEIEGRV
jgi:hypothetical protein